MSTQPGADIPSSSLVIGWNGNYLYLDLSTNTIFAATGFIEPVVESPSKSLLAKCFGYASQERRTPSALATCHYGQLLSITASVIQV